MMAVRGHRVLIVEDEFLLARDLDRYFTSMGAVVLGPSANIQSAGKLVQYADSAVLDVDLNGQKVFPIADRLAHRDIPFVFFSGRGDIAIPLRFRAVPRLSKPLDRESVFLALFPNGTAHSTDTVLAILPKLRLVARILARDAGAADRLVEATLEAAIDRIHQKKDGEDLESWLSDLLEKTHRRFGPRFLQ